jgi:hypothetical protein
MALALLAACHPQARSPIAHAEPAGISIALYDTFALVDDRRTLEVRGGRVELEHVDPGAALASLVIEPLGDGAAFRIGACTREAMPAVAPDAKAKPTPAPGVAAAQFAPVVRCETAAAPGRYLVRVMYVSTALRYRAQHAVVMASPDRATVTSRFAIATPAWRERAEVVVFDGVPGGARPPREVVRGPAVLDGSTAVLTAPPREVAAELRRVYDGAMRARGAQADTVPPTDPGWRQASTMEVWVWLELAHVRLAPGDVRVHVELPGEGVRDADVAADRREQSDAGDAPLRLPLWIDPALHGLRQRFGDYVDGASLAERYLITVANLGDTAREVWIEERLRPLRHHHLERVWPGKPALADDRVRARVNVSPGKLERVGFTVAYDE